MVDMDSGGSCVLRIVNLDPSFTEEELKSLILIKCQPQGNINKIYLKRNYEPNFFCAYIFFEHSYDASKTVGILNGHVHIFNILEVELIGPNLPYPLGDKIVVKCRTCNGDHWISICPWRDILLGGGNIPDDKKAPAPGGANPSGDSGKAGGSEYIPPSMRDGATKRTDGPSMARRDDSYSAIRIANLSDSTTETDLEELVKPFGPLKKLYLAKDKQTGLCKGFAYIHFKFRNDAAKAISLLNGYGYDHLILNVDWSKPLSSSNQ